MWSFSRDVYLRRLGIEPLEDRRLLANVTVSNLNDLVNGNTASIAALVASNGGDGISLRESILAANADAAADTIDFGSLTGTIQLSNVSQNFEIAITNSLAINGPGAAVLTIGAHPGTAAVGDGARIFNVDDGNGSADKTVTISGLTLTGGDPAGASNSGGAIRTAENLTVSSSTISGNTALFGAGIAKVGSTGQLSVSGSTISSNVARSTGGGINSAGGSLNISQSTISGNTALAGSGAGGGIWCSNTPTMIDSSTISGNQALFAGGVQHFGIGTLMTITNSTISGNSSRGDAGGIAAFYGNMTIRHSTITGNRADSDGNATGNGGGLFVSATQSNATIDHTIVAGNLRGAGSTRDDIFRTVAARYSLIGDNTGATITNNGGNQIGTSASPINARLGPLVNNGGLTLTHGLLVGSPAVDAGDPSAVAGVGTVPLNDQRGPSFARVTDGNGVAGVRIDIGAFEQQTTTPASFVVDTLADENDGNFSPSDFSLREAIGLANSISGSDTITFAAALTNGGPATILLTLGELAITDSLTIGSPGASLLTIDATGNDATPTANNGDGSRVFVINDDNSSNLIDVSISGLTITGGDAPFAGGGIASAERLSVIDSVITGNASVRMIGNVLYGFGGGIFQNGGNLTVIRSTVSGNVALDSGGIDARGDVDIRDSTISLNGAIRPVFGTGGGISHILGSLTITNSTISGNTATHSGGGIEANGTLTIRHSTITGNLADSDTDGAGFGGGLHHSAGSMSLEHTIIAGNLRSVSTRDDMFGSVSVRYSLIGVNTGATITNNGGNQIGTGASPINPLLGALANNGGPTMTHALLTGSPAIDAGDPAAVAGVGTIPIFDQRDSPFGRVKDGDSVGGARIDIGAFEVQPVGPALPGDYNQNSVVDGADFVLWRKTLGATGVPAFSGADGDGDTTIDQDDYNVWRAHFGATLPGAGAGSGVSVVAVSSIGNGKELNAAGALAEPVAPEQDVQAGARLARSVRVDSGFEFGTARQVRHGEFRASSSGETMWSLAKPVACEVSRDDALVAWAESAGSVRDSKGIEFMATESDSVETSGDDSCVVLDVAIGELTGFSLL